MQRSLANSVQKLLKKIVDMKAAIYARVSTKDKSQDTENQLAALRQYCEKSGYEIYKEYIDHESGGTSEREMFKEMFTDAYQKRFNIVLFWALDRFSREGVRETINYLSELESYGVDFISYTESFLNSIGIFREAIIAILATLAKQERIKISERVRAGLETAKKKGVRLGRKPIPPVILKKIIDVYEEENGNMSVRGLSKKINMPVSTVHRTLTAYKQGLLDRDGFLYDKPLVGVSKSLS